LKPPTSLKQANATDLLRSRCGGFTEVELSTERQMELENDGRLVPGFNELVHELQAASGADRRLALARVLDTQDALVLQRATSQLILNGGPETVFWNGETVKEPHVVPIASMAWLAAACDATSTECGERDPFVVEACATRDVCLGSRRELLLHDAAAAYGDAGASLFAKLYDGYRSAITSRNVAAFLAP
jgi:hypothetical protein